MRLFEGKVNDLPKFDAYICYNKADRDWVARLAAQLESETIDGDPSSRKLKVFFDEWDMVSGDNLIRKMNEGMNDSRLIITVLTPEFLKSDWTHFEWTHFVAQDPTNRKGCLIPIRLRDVSLDSSERINLCAPFINLKYVDFRKSGDFRRSLVELVNKIRSRPPTRGEQLPPLANISPARIAVEPDDASWIPDQISEHLFSNLFPLIQLPAKIWTASTTAATKKEIWAQVSSRTGFVLRENALFTFGDLTKTDEGLRDVIDLATIKAIDSRQLYDDADKAKWFVELLNINLGSFLYRKGVKNSEKGRFYFMLEKDGADRSIPMPSGRPRIVVKRVQNDEKQLDFYVHQAASLRFKKYDSKFFLSVSPMYLFTSDGRSSIGGKAAGKLSQLWMGKQQNDAIFRDVLFWVYFLSDGKDEARLTDSSDPVRLSSTPASAGTTWGIGWDSIKIKTLFQHEDDDLAKIGEELIQIQDEDEDCAFA